VTDSLPAATSYDTEAVTIAPAPTIADPVIVQTPEPVAPTPEPVKVASLPTPVEPAPTPVIQDVIEEAKLLNSASAKYPRMAERRNYYVNVAIEVAYDIDASGRATNISIASNDHSGKYNEAFEKEAMKVIEKLRYAPKTVNGEAVIETGKEKRIVFRAE